MPTSTLSYLLCESKDMNELFECDYVFVSSLTVTGCFMALWWEQTHLIKFIGDLEAMTSKSNFF